MHCHLKSKIQPLMYLWHIRIHLGFLELQYVREKYFIASSLKDIYESLDSQIIIDFIKGLIFMIKFCYPQFIAAKIALIVSSLFYILHHRKARNGHVLMRCLKTLTHSQHRCAGYGIKL